MGPGLATQLSSSCGAFAFAQAEWVAFNMWLVPGNPGTVSISQGTGSVLTLPPREIQADACDRYYTLKLDLAILLMIPNREDSRHTVTGRRRATRPLLLLSAFSRR